MAKKSIYTISRPTTHEEWLAERKKGVGASVVGQLIGVSKYGTAYRLWRKMTGIDAPVEENWAMVQGHIYEQWIAGVFENETGHTIIKNTAGDWLAISTDADYLRVSPDWLYWPKGSRRNEANKCILEAKSSRMNFTPDCLKDEHLDWFCQLQYQMHVMGLKNGYLGFVCVESGNHWFEPVAYDKEFCENFLLPSIRRFWNENFLPAKAIFDEHGINPDTIELAHDFAPSITDADDTTLRYPKEIAGKTITADIPLQTIIAERKEMNKVKTDAEKRVKELDDEIKIAMADNEVLLDADKRVLATWKASKPRVKFDDKKFKTENEQQYSKYCYEVQGSRTLLIK